MAAHNGEHSSAQATHYEVLNIAPDLLDSHLQDPSTLLKRAYHRALLRNHPDKTTRTQQQQQQQYQTTKPSPVIHVYTVDQISTAFTVLSSTPQRTAYDAALRLSRAGGVSDPSRDAADFQTGVENVDLDDLAFDEGEERWYRPCRCGNERGYSFQEADLDEVADEGLLMLGCQDCSLWLKVHFAIVDDDGGDN